LSILADGDKSSGALRTIINLKHHLTFRENYLCPALDAGLIIMTIPGIKTLKQREAGMEKRVNESLNM